MNDRTKQFDSKMKVKWHNMHGHQYKKKKYHLQEFNEKTELYETVYTFDESLLSVRMINAFNFLHQQLGDGSDRAFLDLLFPDKPGDPVAKHRVIVVD